MINKRVATALDDLTQNQRERLFYIEVKAFFCGDLTRADIERRFGVKPAASARDLSTYRRLAPLNLFYDAGQRKSATTDRFTPLFEHSASEPVKPEIETLAKLTRVIAGRYLWLSNPQTLYGVESADLASGFKRTKGQA